MIKFNDLAAQWNCVKYQALPKMMELLDSGEYVSGLGEQYIQEFEYNFAKYNNSKYAVGVDNGTGALIMALEAFNLDPEETEVFIQANTYIADAFVPRTLQYYIHIIDNDKNYQIDLNSLEYALENKSKLQPYSVVIITHMYGIPCNMEKLLELKQRYNFILIEDCSHAHGTKIRVDSLVTPVGNIGDISIFSLYPGKSLGAVGEAGIVVTNDKTYYEKLCLLRNHGCGKVKYSHQKVGLNHRMDALQAIVLSEKLKLLDNWISTKNNIVMKYITNLSLEVRVPEFPKWADKISYYVFPIRVKNRDEVQAELNKKEIPTVIHYPNPIHRTPTFKSWGIYAPLSEQYSKELLSLPLHPFLTEQETDYIIKSVNELI